MESTSVQTLGTPASTGVVPSASLAESTLPAAAKFDNLKEMVGLFGTCGGSAWRDPVIAKLEAAGIASFNPVVPKWTPECADREAEHLATDRVLLFVITGETEGYGSLAETGWAALSAHRNGQKVIFVIEDFPDGDAKSPANRARKLVRTHAATAGVTVYGNVDAGLQVVIEAMSQ